MQPNESLSLLGNFRGHLISQIWKKNISGDSKFRDILRIAIFQGN